MAVQELPNCCVLTLQDDSVIWRINTSDVMEEYTAPVTYFSFFRTSYYRSFFKNVLI